MGFTRKSSKMYGYLQAYKYKISDGFGEMFFAPLSKKLVRRLKMRYDSKIPIEKVIAFCDTSVLKQAKRGIVFTEDGFYHKFIGTPIFISYKSIDSMLTGHNGLEIYTDNYFSYTLIDSFNYAILKSVLLELKSIDNAYGQDISRESGKVTEKSAVAQVGKVAKGTAKVAGKVAVGTAKVAGKLVVAIVDDMLESGGSTQYAQDKVRQASNNPNADEKTKILNEMQVIQLKMKEVQNKINGNTSRLKLRQSKMKKLAEEGKTEEVQSLNEEIKEITNNIKRLGDKIKSLKFQLNLLKEKLDKIKEENNK